MPALSTGPRSPWPRPSSRGATSRRFTDHDAALPFSRATAAASKQATSKAAAQRWGEPGVSESRAVVKAGRLSERRCGFSAMHYHRGSTRVPLLRHAVASLL